MVEIKDLEVGCYWASSNTSFKEELEIDTLIWLHGTKPCLVVHALEIRTGKISNNIEDFTILKRADYPVGKYVINDKSGKPKEITIVGLNKKQFGF